MLIDKSAAELLELITIATTLVADIEFAAVIELVAIVLEADTDPPVMFVPLIVACTEQVPELVMAEIDVAVHANGDDNRIV